MKFTLEIETRPMSFDILDDLINLLQDDGLRKKLESIIEDYLKDFLTHQGMKDIAVRVELL